MLYIHQTSCISAQQTFFLYKDLENLQESLNNKLNALEPSYEGIPKAVLRRMGKSVRIGIGAALPLVNATAVNGIIIGTANGGMEDCIEFLNQIIQYDEGMLTPTNFVQSTANAIASQLSFLSANKGYNITHVHRGLAFENAVIDAVMKVNEYPEHSYLLGGVEEISAYNYNIEYLKGWYKMDPASNINLYYEDSSGSLAGEGAAMFIVNGNPVNAKAKLNALATLHSEDEQIISQWMKNFLNTYSKESSIDTLLTGENGDSRLLKYYQTCEEIIGVDISVARFKHMSGEYETASAQALWLACELFETQTVPSHMWKVKSTQTKIKHILIYNAHKGYQHSLMLISKP